MEKYSCSMFFLDFPKFFLVFPCFSMVFLGFLTPEGLPGYPRVPLGTPGYPRVPPGTPRLPSWTPDFLVLGFFSDSTRNFVARTGWKCLGGGIQGRLARQPASGGPAGRS